MKHGHKKGKAQAPSGKKSKPATKIQASQGGSTKKAAASTKAAAPARTSGKNDVGKGRGNDSVSFSNPVVANAFKRAVKKYPSAFKRLTD